MKTKTPELDKQHAVVESGAMQVLTDFYDWLYNNGYYLAKFQRFEEFEDPQLYIAGIQPEQLFADFFGIDRNKIEAERRALLEELRAIQ